VAGIENWLAFAEKLFLSIACIARGAAIEEKLFLQST
jgi:hypothetical protein